MRGVEAENNNGETIGLHPKSATGNNERTVLRRHGRACPGHPRLRTRKTWMPGTRPGMTMEFDARKITIKKQKGSVPARSHPKNETRKQWKQWKTMKTHPECTLKVRHGNN